MKKFEILGKTLSKEEQKKIKGGSDPGLCTDGTCGQGGNCDSIGHGCACHDVVGSPNTQVCATGR